MPSILEKVRKGKLLDEKEAGFLRYCAYFLFKETNKEEKSRFSDSPKSLKPEPKKPKTLHPKPELLKPPESSKPMETFPVSPSPEPTPRPKPPEPESSVKNIERRVLSLEEAENNLNIE